MEKRKETLSGSQMCRFCLSQTTPLINFYEKSQSPRDPANIKFKILSCLSVEVFPSDKMPAYICERCKFFMNIFHDFKKVCRQADEAILKYIQNGTALQAMSWPRQLLKLHSNSKKESVVKTVVESGATVQVSSQDTSDTEDEDANVYNVKIGDGNDEAKTTQVKVITSDQVEKPKTSRKGFGSIPKLARHVRTHAGERPYPCKYCDKSFLKSQHYTRHLRIKHRDNVRSSRNQDQDDSYPCEQCEEIFITQDDLIYHSAIHATQNLICPLCEEKFENVDSVTTHIKSHVNGLEFMCDFCELIFTTKDKYENHLMIAHEEEIQNELGEEESSMEVQGDGIEDDEDDNSIQVKDAGDHMVIEIKKADNFMLNQEAPEESEYRGDNTNSEESEAETLALVTPALEPSPVVTITNTKELATVEKVQRAKQILPQATVISTQVEAKALVSTQATIVPIQTAQPKTVVANQPKSTKASVITKANNQPTLTIRKLEDIKRKAVEPPAEIQAKKEKVNKVESSNSAGFSDKSLRLLEKELQDLKRTNSRSDVTKTPPVKAVDTPKSRRPQIITSTPKLRSNDDKKSQLQTKSPAFEKKQIEKRVTKENKEPKEAKEMKNNGNKKDEEKEKESKETPKSVIKNGTSDKSASDEGIRRSTRPSKIKDYAKMIRDRSHGNSDDDDSDMDDEEYTESTPEPRQKRRASVKTTPKPTPPASVATTPTATPTPRKRGRPRKDANKEVPEKIKKDENTAIESNTQKEDESKPIEEVKSEKPEITATIPSNTTGSEQASTEQKSQSNVILSPTGQTLKKVPIKALPPGVKPMPLPMNARPMGQGELCEMQIGKKVVKVQKIVMTKAEVEAMAKKGLVEMKDGTMVLKQGIKLPTATADVKDSPTKKEKAVPTRCDLGDD
ncbi:RE1-silencing transcription factor-like isoform X2 [Colias croceus]|uniref:RE1-silencing transcription factor-like isoform X2 n=1 Tax=Colias crocea TaxID=72248 RepID=UPI001E279F13|nr:RE1-silencing transcription factor-like isoform X2 [Colias croceus]